MTELLRIGELAQRTGVNSDLLRAWERRYALLRPTRTSGGFRVYTEDDVERVRQMRDHVQRGIAAAEAAALVLAADGGGQGAGRGLPVDADELAASLDAFDDRRAQLAFDRLIAQLSTESIVADVVLPYLRDLGSRWERGKASVAQEHFASQILRGRLLGLARGWDAGSGPRAILLCPSGEEHDLGLICSGLILREYGWRITLLGRDMPIEPVAHAAERIDPDAVVVAALDAGRITAVAARLKRLAAHWPVYVAGAAVTDSIARRCGAQLLIGDPVEGALRLAQAQRAPV